MPEKIRRTQIIDVNTVPAGIPVDFFVAYEIVSELLKNGCLIIRSREMKSGKIKVNWEMESNQIA